MIKVLRLVNGEDIIGAVDITDTQYVITSPLRTERLPFLNPPLDTWCGVSPYDTIPIRKDHVIVCLEPYPYHHHLEALYLEHLQRYYPAAYVKVV